MVPPEHPLGVISCGSPRRTDNTRFLESRDARALRILAEYLEPLSRFQRLHVQDTIVFLGSARLKSREAALAALAEAEKTGSGLEAARTAVELSEYYEAARSLAHRLTEWSKQLASEERRFVICTGGGPGIMEAANRGASEAKGYNVGLTIALPNEQFDNTYVSRELHVHFHYFFMRKFWFAYLAKAAVFFPAGSARWTNCSNTDPGADPQIAKAASHHPVPERSSGTRSSTSMPWCATARSAPRT